MLIYAVTSLVLFAEADWRLMLPLLVWIVGYIAALYYFVPRVKERSVISSDARSKLMGRIVDGYTNIATLKLFAHTDYEQQYAREAIREQTEKPSWRRAWSPAWTWSSPPSMACWSSPPPVWPCGCGVSR